MSLVRYYIGLQCYTCSLVHSLSHNNITDISLYDSWMIIHLTELRYHQFCYDAQPYLLIILWSNCNILNAIDKTIIILIAQVQKNKVHFIYFPFTKNSIKRLPNTFKKIFGNKGIISKIPGLFHYNPKISGLKKGRDSGNSGSRDPKIPGCNP